MPRSFSRRFLLLVCTAWPLASCAAGPDFVPPEPPPVSSYGQTPTPEMTAASSGALGAAQRFAPGADIPADWWHLFGSAALNRMIDQAISANPSVQAAEASLSAAQETAKATWGGFLPSISGSASDTRTKVSGSEKPSTVYKASLGLTYAPDIFGATRRAYEGKKAAADAAQYELEAAYLTLTSSLTSAAVEEASLRAQIRALANIIDIQKKHLSLIEAQFRVGATAKTAVLAQEASLASNEAALPSLEKQLAQTRHLIAVLMGRFPSEDIGATFELTDFKLPEELPVSLPSDLVAQRPDVRTALENLHEANANVGIAMAAMLPQFPLTGSFGVSAARMSEMFSPTTALWGLAAGIVQPIFEGGTLLHEKRASEAAFDRAAALYRNTVLDAFRNVADTLRALEADAQTLKARETAAQAAAASLDLTAKQYKVGAVDYITLLSAQTADQQSKANLVLAQAARLADTAALYQALGGGWWNKKEK